MVPVSAVTENHGNSGNRGVYHQRCFCSGCFTAVTLRVVYGLASFLAIIQKISRVLYGYPSVHGAVFRNRKSYGPVQCGIKKSEILWCGSVQCSDML